jgi:hypothetical protein
MMHGSHHLAAQDKKSGLLAQKVDGLDGLVFPFELCIANS